MRGIGEQLPVGEVGVLAPGEVRALARLAVYRPPGGKVWMLLRKLSARTRRLKLSSSWK